MALAAAWSLGMILLGKGERQSDDPQLKATNNSKGSASNNNILLGQLGLADLCVEDRLQLLIDGGIRPPDSLLFPVSL